MRIKYAIASGLVLLTAFGAFGGPAYAADNPAAAPTASAAPTAAPSPVTNVQWEYHSATSVDLFWAGPTDGSTQYRVDVTLTSGGKKTSSTFNANKPSLLIPDVTPGGKLEASVVAYNSLGEATSVAAPGYTQPPTSPDAPRNVKMSALASPQAKVSWQAPEFDGGASVLTYTVSVYTSSTKKVYWVQSVDAKKTSVTVPMLKSSTGYYATVTAVNNHGTGPDATSNKITSAVDTAPITVNPSPVPTVTQTITVPTPSVSQSRLPPPPTPIPTKSAATATPRATQQDSIMNTGSIVLILLVALLAAAVTALIFVVHADNKRLRGQDDTEDSE